MASTFHGIEVAKRSLTTQMTAINTTGHNISNADTEGYSRQTVNMATTSPMEAYGIIRSTAAGQLGTGVEATSINRIRDYFLDSQYRSSNSSYSSWDVRFDTLSKIETIFNEPSDTSLQTTLDDFWNAWSDLANDPDNVTNRNILAEASLALTDSFNNISKNLTELDSDLSDSIELDVTSINGLLDQIATLNQSIRKIEGLGDDANDLRDKRDYYIDQLSELANVSVTELDTGYEVTLGGQVVVTGETVTQVSSASLTAAYQSGALTGGEIHGLLASKTTVADYSSQLNKLASTLATGDIEVTIPAGSRLPDGTTLNGVTYSDANGNRTLSSDLTVTVQGINGLHKLGYNLSAQAGVDFFTASDSGTITAANITLNTSIQDDPNLIASSLKTTGTGTGETTVVGNSGLALLVSNLKSANFTFTSTTAGATSETTTINDYLNSILGQLGVETQNAERQMENSETLKDQVESSRQSVSGVSLDEEMANLLKFQNAYSAASRFMTTYDELLEKLINGTGTVGL